VSAEDHRARIERFFAAWGESFDALLAAFREHLAEDARWEQSALPTTTSRDEAIGLLEAFRAQLGLATIDVDLMHLAVDGDVVLTERVDQLRDDVGGLIASFPVMGVLELDEAGRIRAWREFFDPREALELMARATPTAAPS
jgi:limonene-1,2-epoxide hydrolase